MNNMQELRTIAGSINTNVRKSMKVDEYLSKLTDQQLDMELSTIFRNLRSHADYWMERRRQLKTMIKFFGAPTWFITLNPAENEWAELRATYEKVYQHLVCEKITTAMFVIMDAAIFARHFSQRLNAVFKNMLVGKEGVYGHGNHFFKRLEYQLRGAQHAHTLLWIDGAPNIMDNTPEEIIKYVDPLTTTRMPNPKEEPELYDLVSKLQIHKCIEATCGVKRRIGGKTYHRCRFMFPYAPQLRTTLVQKKFDAKDPKVTKDLLLKRAPGCENVNAYNAAILLAWRGNMDAQFLGEMKLATIDYVTSYISKAESKSKTESVISHLKTLPKNEAFKMAFEMLRVREIGMPEMYDLVLGHHLFECSSSVLSLNNNEDRVRIVLPKYKIDLLNEGDSITEKNWYDNHYPCRPSSLERICLFSAYIGLQYKQKVKTSGNKEFDEKCNENEDEEPNDDEEPNETEQIAVESGVDPSCAEGEQYQELAQSLYHMFPKGRIYIIPNGGGCFVPRLKFILPQFFLEDMSDCVEDEKSEKLYRRLLFMFKPWRDEHVDLKVGFESYAEAWQEFYDQCGDMMKQDIQKIM